MMAPLLTVGIPVYNGMPWLPEALASLRQQTCPDFAVLIIDDGSTDRTPEYLRSIRDSRFRIVRQENRGITATLNRMLEEVDTPWLVRQDTDDVAFPARVERTLEFVQRFPDAGMFYSHAAHYQNGHRLLRLRTSEGDPAQLRQLTRSGYLPAICHSAVVLNVEKVRRLDGYRFDLNIEEYDLYWRMALAYDIRLIPETLVGYRIHAGSVSGADLRNQVVNLLYVQYLLLSELWNEVAQPYQAVRPCLQTMVDERLLRYRMHMREAVSCIGMEDYVAAIVHAGRAIASSPRHFSSRLLDGAWQRQLVSVGAPPETFRRHADQLWQSSLVVA